MKSLAKIIRPIYIRSGPGRSFDALGTVEPDDTYLEMHGVVSGETWKGVNSWHYRLTEDNQKLYYWTGGLTTIPGSELHWSLRQLGVDKVWSRAQGEGVRLAILDTGIALNQKHFSIVAQANMMAPNETAQGVHPHGNYCACIAAARNQGGAVIGVAPKCDLIIIKIANKNSDLTNTENIIAGLRKAAEFKADIISMSFGSSQSSNTLELALKNLMQKGIICIAAAGDLSNHDVLYPAKIKGMISVGNAATRDINAEKGEFFVSGYSATARPDSDSEGITVIAPGTDMSVYDLGDEPIDNAEGTSMAAPYVAGLAALWIERLRKSGKSTQNAHEDFREFLISSSTQNNIKDFSIKRCGAGLVRPTAIT